MVDLRKCDCAAPGCDTHWLHGPRANQKRCGPCKVGDHYPHGPKTVAPPGEAKGW